MPTVVFYILLFLISAIMVSMIPPNLVNLLRDLGSQDDPEHPDENANASGSGNETSTEEQNSYNPTPVDIGIVRIMLARAMKIPPTLIDEIFEHAEYWASSSNQVDFNLEHQAPMTISGTREREDAFLVSQVYGSESAITNKLLAAIISRWPHGYKGPTGPFRGASV